MQFDVGIHTIEYVYTYRIYMSNTIRHMHLQVGYNLSYVIVPNVVACGVCNYNLVTNTSCKTNIFF
jgi:hypothetical protein